MGKTVKGNKALSKRINKTNKTFMLFWKIELIGIPDVVQEHARSTTKDKQNKHNVSILET